MAYASNAVRGTAFHEAGSAVVARYFGQKVIKLEIREDGSGKTETVGATCAGEASRTIFKCRSHALAVSSEISKLMEVLVDDHRLEIRNAGYRRAIEIIKSNAPEVEQLAGRLIKQRRVREALE